MDKNECTYTRTHIHTHTHTHNGVLLSHKNNEILPFATTWIDLEGTKLSELRQTEKNKYRMMYDFIYTWNLKKQMNKHNKPETDA